jgi:hypothetical protein
MMGDRVKISITPYDLNGKYALDIEAGLSDLGPDRPAHGGAHA